jgi:hypothetical protein
MIHLFFRDSLILFIATDNVSLSNTVGMITNTITRHEKNAINNGPIKAIEFAMKRYTNLAIVFDHFRWLSATAATVLRQVFLFRHNHPDKAAFTALHLILIHRPNISGFL